MNSPTRHALIIGASRGLGAELARELANRGWNTVATSRATSSPLSELMARSPKLPIQNELVDINHPDQLLELRHRLSGRQFDLIFINAGINRSDGSVAEVSTEEFTEVMITNALSPVRALETLRELAAPGATVGVMSSEQGSISLNDEPGFEVYKASKAALNQLMRSYATRYAAAGHTILLIDPGHNRTNLGGTDAPLAPTESIPRVVDVIESSAGGSGILFLDRNGAPVPW